MIFIFEMTWYLKINFLVDKNITMRRRKKQSDISSPFRYPLSCNWVMNPLEAPSFVPCSSYIWYHSRKSAETWNSGQVITEVYLEGMLNKIPPTFVLQVGGCFKSYKRKESLLKYLKACHSGITLYPIVSSEKKIFYIIYCIEQIMSNRWKKLREWNTNCK